VAFLAHSFVDFNFFNPSLAMFEFLMGGLFLARAGTGEQPEPNRPVHRVVAVVLLAVAALVAGAGARLYLSERMVGNQVMRDAYLRVGEFFLNRANPENFDPKRPPAETASAIGLLIPDRAILESFGTLQVRQAPAGKTWRKIGPSEPLPPQAVFVVTNPGLAQTRAREGIREWLRQVERADAIYPYSADIAAYLFQWSHMLVGSARDPQERKDHVLACQKWAQRSVDRSPEQFIFHECLARALLLRGTVETGPRQLEFYRGGLEEYKRAALLYPIEPVVWRNYRDELQRFGRAFAEAGDSKTGQAMLAEAESVTKQIEELQKRYEALSPPKRGNKK
jgi:hypothetical protein